MTTAGLVLAAGRSSRMGSPKALLLYDGETFADRLVGLFAQVCSPVFLVLGHEPERIESGLRRPVQTLLNPDYDCGQLSSLQVGLRALPLPIDAVLWTLVDLPAVRLDTLRVLVNAPPADLVLPRYQGKRGHPVLIRRPLCAEFLALPPTAAANEVIRRYAETAAYVDVDDPAILRDVDDAAGYAALLAEERA